MTIGGRNLLVLAAFITGALAIFIHYDNLSRQADSVGTQRVVVDSTRLAKNKRAENHYQECLTGADTSHDVAWEINCENLIQGAAQKYNACVTNAAFTRKLTAAPKACESNCRLPKPIAEKLDRAKEEAKARCLKDMQTWAGN